MIETAYVQIPPAERPDPELLRQGAALLALGELVAFPTETVYGLGGNALNPHAVEAIFAAKGRPGDNPLIVHVADVATLNQVAAVTPLAERLMAAFWPGPLTLVLPKKPAVPDCVTAGRDTVAVRFPSHPVASLLIQMAGVPVAAPSANLSGKPSPTTGAHVWHDLRGKVAMVIHSGPANVGLESTVLDVTGEVPVVLRPGGVTLEMIRRIAPQAVAGGAKLKEGEAPKAPGMKYRHYAPKAKVVLANAGEVAQCYRQLQAGYTKVGAVVAAETAASLPEASYVRVLGRRNDLVSVAQNLFDALRWCDDQELDAAVVESFPEQGIGAAIMNRLKKSAAG